MPYLSVLRPALAAGAALLTAAAGSPMPPSVPHESPGAALVDPLGRLDRARWAPQEHPLGRGVFRAAHVLAAGGELRLRLPAGTRDGGEIRSADRFGHGGYEARLRTPVLPGSISAFFLYQGEDGGDEIDVEIHNDGSRRAMFTVWVQGRQVHSVTRVLPFDPAEGSHRYRIEWTPSEVRFVVDGVTLERWTGEVPRHPMYLMANAWWPAWLDGEPAGADRWLALHGVRAAPGAVGE